MLLAVSLTQLAKKSVKKLPKRLLPLLCVLFNVGLVMLMRQSLLMPDVLDGLTNGLIGTGMFAVSKELLKGIGQPA